MEKLFLAIANMSASATWLLMAVLFLRLILKKAPRTAVCALWGLLGLRLMLPFSIESIFSLLPSAEVFPEEFLYAAKPEIESGIEFIDNAVNTIIGEVLAPEPTASANPTQINSFIFSLLWLFGVAAMLVYMAVSFIRVKLRVREAVLAGENIWLCDRVDTPFILGIILPKIYLPLNITESDAIYVIAHEKAHIKRLDYIWKPLGFLLLALHWFNPTMWLAYVLFCRDIEFACDEKVIRTLGDGEKKPYSEALLNLSMPHRAISACPLAFGEVGVKERIKSVLNYKKPAFWVIIVSIVLVIATAVGFLTSPLVKKDLPNNENEYVNGGNGDGENGKHDENGRVEITETDMPTDKSKYKKEFITFIYTQINDEYSIKKMQVFDWEIIAAKKSDTRITIYAWVMVTGYYEVSSTPYSGMYSLGIYDHSPTVIVIDGALGIYSLAEYWRASENDEGENAIKEKFPEELLEDAFNPDKYRVSQYERCKKKAPYGEGYYWIT
ncbi:MAG: hypothetical protein IJX27_06355 [Clostridia bacterium]|nr:hypothetical protein [Clostridia bacterium]